MKRRDFIVQTALASVAGTGMSFGLSGRLLAQQAPACEVADLPRTLVNVMLNGGADLRFPFMPAPDHPDTVYVNKIWTARKALYPSYPDYQAFFDNEYLLTSNPAGPDFGIYRRCGWLKSQFDRGRVAIVSNAFCSRNRRHDQSILNANAGDPDFDVFDQQRDGWGGRLVEAIGGGANCVELSGSVSLFNNGTNSSERLARVIHAANTRDIALPSPDDSLSVTNRRNILARALKSYYDARGVEVASEKPADWPYHAFYQHNAAFRSFGDRVEARLKNCPMPAELADLSLISGSWAQQCRNLHDACIVPDELNARIMSMSYGGWDTHLNQAARIGNNLEDILGSNGGLATATAQIASLPYLVEPASKNLLFYFATDFGRQLRANGNAGTDHGRGLNAILVAAGDGSGLQGGVYGEMFPTREALPDGDGKIPLETSGADVLGLTSTEKILAEVSEWMQPGAGAAVFPGAVSAAVESPGLVSGLMAGV